MTTLFPSRVFSALFANCISSLITDVLLFLLAFLSLWSFSSPISSSPTIDIDDLSSSFEIKTLYVHLQQKRQEITLSKSKLLSIIQVEPDLFLSTLIFALSLLKKFMSSITSKSSMSIMIKFATNSQPP